uniref:UPF3A regulator of nonsense mediated mRNA decay n=1 Tax=Leptobrachium leishanense TaxID=445787 RepID=A0A8C5MZW2_9ANUR
MGLIGGIINTELPTEYSKSVVIRRLPPSISKEQLEEQLHPLPAHDYFEFCAADPSLYPHLFSRAYINFRNPEDILLFRDRFDGFIFIDNKGQEYPAVVEFAPFQKISKKKLKKKDTKAGSITDDLEYKKFLENYCADEEKVCANPETLLGEIEAKTKELIGLCLMIFAKNQVKSSDGSRMQWKSADSQACCGIGRTISDDRTIAEIRCQSTASLIKPMLLFFFCLK